VDKNNYEYLKGLPYLGERLSILDMTKAWYGSDDTVITVANILDRQGIFSETRQVIDYFENPCKWEGEIHNLLREYEYEVLSC